MQRAGLHDRWGKAYYGFGLFINVEAVMADAYNFESNVLEINDKNNNHYRLELRGNKNQIKGNSGTGKTYLYDLIESIKKKAAQSDYNVDNIITLSALNLSQLREFEDKLIMIDRAEYLLNRTEIEYINSDTSNRYLIFSRVPLGIEMSPNHQADFVEQEGVTVMKYRFDVEYIHTGPVIRREEVFARYSIDERRKLLYKMLNFVNKCRFLT